MTKKINIKNKILKLFIICFVIGIVLSMLFYFSLDKSEIKSIIFSVEENKILLKRFAEPNEIATVVYFLSTEESKYINNEVIRVDGGTIHA